MYENDPLWKMRYALAGVGIALLISVFIAAFAGAALGDLIGDSYGVRVACYAALLAYVVAGAAVLFSKVARHETRPLTAGRLGLWLISLWMWPALLAAGRGQAPAADEGQPDGPGDSARAGTGKDRPASTDAAGRGDPPAR
jgi:hypothetical protein